MSEGRGKLKGQKERQVGSREQERERGRETTHSNNKTKTTNTTQRNATRSVTTTACHTDDNCACHATSRAPHAHYRTSIYQYSSSMTLPGGGLGPRGHGGGAAARLQLPDARRLLACGTNS